QARRGRHPGSGPVCPPLALGADRPSWPDLTCAVLYRIINRSTDQSSRGGQMSDTTLDPAATAQPASGTAVYSLVGTLIEACSCGVNCPCWIGEDPDLGECFAIIAYGLDEGLIRGVDVSGLNLLLLCHIPLQVMGWEGEIVALVGRLATNDT